MKKNASFPTIVLFTLLCLAAPLSSAYAEIQGVATVVALRGTVVAQGKSGPGRNLSLKSQIYQEDVLKTDKTGQLQIMFPDNSIISLGRDSEMKISEYRWQPEQKDGALRTQVKEGTFRVMGGALAKDAPQNFKTETPTATIGIRGSMYTFMSTKDSLSVLFQGGKGIEIFNDLGKVIITTPGFGTHVVLNAPPARPTKFTEQELNNLNRGLNGNGGPSGSDNGAPPLAGTISPPPPTAPLPPPLPPYTEPYIPLPTTPPTDGIFRFDGTIVGVDTDSSGTIIDSFTNSMSMGVNWHNHRILGVAYDDQGDKPVFFFGSANGPVISDLTILGADFGFGWLNSVGINSGSGTGVFAGAAYDLFAFAATGNTYLMPPLATPSVYSSWTAAGAGQQVPGALTPVAPTGTETWQGFVTGQSMKIADTSTDHAIYQSDPGSFTMTVNKDAGTINGVMTPGAPLMLLNETSFDNISGLTIGGDATKSVYLRDDLIAALITGGGGSPTLGPNGSSFMVVADPSEQFSSYVTWGYWQIAYHDTASNTDRIMPSLWIAGKPTIDMPTNLTGTYNGTAIGTEYNLSVGGQASIIGTCALTANFGSTTGTGAVSGNIYFTGVTLPISTGAITSNQFTAAISDGSTITGSVKGGFFGPAASTVGGNFSAKDGTNMKAYLGIFGGNRGPLFAP